MNCIIHKTGKGRPIVAVVGGVHGDELVGKKIIDKIRNFKIIQGKLITIIANPMALKKKKRFIDQDLNRLFPGKRNGNREEKIAYKIQNTIKEADFVFDIHSTTTDVKSLLIIAKKNKSVFSFIKLLSPKYVALMKKEIAKKSLIYQCRAGVSFEYGKDNSKITKNKILNDILFVLKNLKMIKGNIKIKNNRNNNIRFYKITNVIKKSSGFILNKKIKNFKLVKKGQLIGKNKKVKIIAKRDFYPILFGGKAYKDIFGFIAEKIDDIRDI